MKPKNRKEGKRLEAITEHADSLPNNTHDSILKTSSHEKNNINFYQSVYDLIPEGQNNAISMSALSYLLKADKRTVRTIITGMRKEGYLIASDTAGYYRPVNTHELFKWYHAAYSRGITSLQTLKHARRQLAGNGIQVPDLLKELQDDEPKGKK